MTLPLTHPRTGNEQRIASLEAEVRRLTDSEEGYQRTYLSMGVAGKKKDTQIAALESEVVTMREALEDCAQKIGTSDSVIWGIAYDKAVSVLSSSTDYEGKVVVDKELWEAHQAQDVHIRGIMDQIVVLADAIRKERDVHQGGEG